ncbi:hypothetical protein [Hymenobacter properus]|uniref:Uncharacterized protein n=1 Tax=Hymenobacter properus TaxID=2791026 RepID=A0A931BAM9_9BACT|nr:hypothetical protein [Hymenobacter properus]MBF9140375.1 hypothetical protein [Hymenobacter properus]MBR7719182.1 hypothetical protein [Microvirga sp. SRT04]
MKVGKQFNTLTYGEYLHLIENHKKFTDFNTLGLFRSIVETTKLSLEEKLKLRQVAVAAFAKTFEFLQLKDPRTYLAVMTLGENLTVADKNQVWENIRHNQQRILESKKLNHRNFGTYSKHDCGYDTCFMNGLMTKQGSTIAYYGSGEMGFGSDTCNWAKELKAERRKKDRKEESQIVRQSLDSE